MDQFEEYEFAVDSLGMLLHPAMRCLVNNYDQRISYYKSILDSLVDYVPTSKQLKKFNKLKLQYA